MANQPTSKERDAFEAWARDRHWMLDRNPNDRDRYQSDGTQSAWWAWQARSTNEPRATIGQLRAWLKEYIESLNDDDREEWYGSDRAVGEVVVREFLDWLQRGRLGTSSAQPPGVAHQKASKELLERLRRQVHDMRDVPMHAAVPFYMTPSEVISLVEGVAYEPRALHEGTLESDNSSFSKP